MGQLETLWHRGSSWPRDPHGYTFILRAMQLVGRAMFPDAWTGQEPLAELPLRLPKTRPVSPTTMTLDRAEGLLALVPWQLSLSPKILDGATRRSPGGLISNTEVARLRAARLSDAEWEEAVQLSEKEYEAASPPVWRWFYVKTEVARLAEAGTLVFASRPLAGGPLYQVKTEVWNTENMRSRFYYGQYNPTDPYGTGLPIERSHYLFVDEDSFEAWLKGRVAARTEAAIVPTPYPVSRYLRTMLSVSERLAITPDNQPKKVLVELELSRAWGDDPPLSKRLLEAMATLLREPESQAGRGRRP